MTSWETYRAEKLKQIRDIYVDAGCFQSCKENILDTIARMTYNTLRAKKPKNPYGCYDDVRNATELWIRQKGKCFYTDEFMDTECSFDRIHNRIGYRRNNVVLCTTRANRIKSDQTLEELQLWMPGWYARIRKFLDDSDQKSNTPTSARERLYISPS